MATKKAETAERSYRLIMRIGYSVALILVALASAGFVFILETKNVAFEQASVPVIPLANSKDRTNLELPAPFPVGVDPRRQSISENPDVDTYVAAHLTSNHTGRAIGSGWFSALAAELSKFEWYQNLASPSTRTLVVRSGERIEEVTQNFGSILGWSRNQRNQFRALVASSTPQMSDGKLYAGTYVVPKGTAPEFVATLIIDRFDSEVRSRYTPEIEAKVPIEEAIIIASMIEREAYDFTDMRYIAGIIWNRLFDDMALQLDATLQYAKGSQLDQPWWPQVVPDDKYITSPYNTYQNQGLPPGPIANPSIDAIVAALNPRETDCMYYFHDSRSGFHCSPTYEGHVAGLRKYYGQGR